MSEFAGAAAELAEALHVNPYDIERTAATLHRALTLPEGQRRSRMRALHRRVLSYDVARWAESFLGALAEASAQSRPTTVAMTAPGELARTVATLRAAAALLVLLDYDGTLVPFAAVPELAAPDGALLALLARLAARPRTTVHVMSGRIRDTLERREERARMGTTGREGVREQYLITRNLRRWLFFLHALGRPGERVITVS